ncbi:MAG: DUF1211 domain-containing protein [Chitinophagaceae bacterium]|nr:DUF1211 domain-containing protein [Chitinophagaceae bacterium]
MSQSLHNELKREFQLERLILFSDAVFAIAITLLVIEIKVPELHHDVSDKALLKELGHLIPKFIGFIISFIFIGLYWTIHHRMFGYVTNYSGKLLRLNLFFLFFIALLPFSTGFYSEYAGADLYEKGLKVPMTFYVLNFASAGFMIYLMWRHIGNPANKLAEPKIDEGVLKMAKMRALLVPCVFLSMLLVAYLVSVIIAVYLPLLLLPIMRIMRSRMKKKYPNSFPS